MALARRAGLARSGPLRRSPLVGGRQLRRTPLSAVGRRAASDSDERRALTRELEDTPRPCAAGPALAAEGITGCTGRAQHWHERRKRSSAGSILNRANLVASCDVCNSLIEDHPLEARRAGLVAREGDPDWESLGRRHDRHA